MNTYLLLDTFALAAKISRELLTGVFLVKTNVLLSPSPLDSQFSDIRTVIMKSPLLTSPPVYNSIHIQVVWAVPPLLVEIYIVTIWEPGRVFRIAIVWAGEPLRPKRVPRLVLPR